MKHLAALAAALVLAACSSTSTSSSAKVHPASPSPSVVVSPSASPMPSASPTQLPPITNQSEVILSMRMTSLYVMWAATPNRVLRSTNAGRGWVNVTPPNQPGQWTGFFALDDSAAWAVHSDYGATQFTVFRTIDGGRTWARSTGSEPRGGGGEVTFVDRLHGWLLVGLGAAAGSEAVGIAATLDGGKTWQEIARTDDPTTGQGPSGLEFSCDKGELAFGTATVGLLPTDCAGGAPIAYRTTDGGHHWSAVKVPVLGISEGGYGFAAPTFLTATDVVMEGKFYPDTGVATSRDGGATWNVSRLPGTGTIDFESGLSGWQLNATLSATTDGGRTWHALNVPRPPFNGLDMTLQYLGRGVAIAFGVYQTTAYRTDDGGRTWRSVAPAGLHS